MSTALALSRKIAATPWSWDAVAWRQGATDLGLKPEPGSGKERLEFSDPAGAHWTAYLDGPRVENIEVTFDVFLETDQLSTDDFDRKSDEFLEKFEAHSAALSAEFGKSRAIDEEDQEENFPEAGECLYLALWRLHDKLLMLALKSEDREVPIRLCLIVLPGPEDS